MLYSCIHIATVGVKGLKRKGKNVTFYVFRFVEHATRLEHRCWRQHGRTDGRTAGQWYEPKHMLEPSGLTGRPHYNITVYITTRAVLPQQHHAIFDNSR